MVERAWVSMGHFLYRLDPNIKKVVRKLKRLRLKDLKKKTLRVHQPNMVR